MMAGNSNNRYADNDTMTVFDGRLTLGVTNWINGSGVWQQTLSRTSPWRLRSVRRR